MVVKEDRGRKRYILFSHSGKTSKPIIEKFIRDEIQILGGKIRSKLIKFGSKKSIVRVDHNLLTKARDIMNKKKSLEIKTIRTSGTLKTLGKY
tara:strand:- start:1802 stop:2080 length:279 start_codon:yes stop_codon:yes gene_type:complete